MMKKNKNAVLAWLLVLSMVLPLFSSTFPSYATEAIITEDYDAMTIPEILEEDKSLTWVFAGDSITHNAAWSGGRNSYSEWFEQYLYDIGRGDDSVVLTAWGGASAYDFQPESEKYNGLVGKNDPGATLEHMVTKYNPDVVFIKLGMNSRASSTENIVGSYNTMLDELYEDAAAYGKKPKVVLLSPTPLSDENYYDDQAHTETRVKDVLGSVKRVRDLYAEIAEERGLMFCDLRAAFVEESLRLGEDYSRTFFSDSSDGAVHPNAAGQYYIFKTLSKFIGIYDETMPIYQLEYDDINSESLYVDNTYIDKTDFGGEYGSTSGWDSALVENYVWVVAGAIQMSGYEGALPYRSMFRFIDNALRYDDYRDIRLYNLASPDYTNGVADLIAKYDKITATRDYDVFFLLPEIPEVYGNTEEPSEAVLTEYYNNVKTLLANNEGKVRILWTPLASGDETINGYIDKYAEKVRQIAEEDSSILFFDANQFMNDKMDTADNKESLKRNWFEEGAYVSPICSKDVVTAFYTQLNSGDGGKDTLDDEMVVLTNRNIRYSTDTQVFKGNYVRDYVKADASVSGTTVTIDVQAIKEAYTDLENVWFAVLPHKAAGNYHEDIKLLSDVAEVSVSGDIYTFDAPCKNLYLAVYGDRAADDLIYRFKDITLTIDTNKTIPEVVPTPDGVYLDSLKVMSAPDFGFNKDTKEYTVDLYQYQTYATVRATAQEGLTITVNGEEVASDALSQPIKVNDGSKIEVAVTDGTTTEIYTLTCAKPEQPDIIITEVLQDGYRNYEEDGTWDNYELVEIYNASGRELNLLDYSLGYKKDYTYNNITKANNAEYPYYFTGNDQAFSGTAGSGCQATYTGIKPITKYSVYWGEENVEPEKVVFPADSTMVIWIRSKTPTDVRATLTYDTLLAALEAHGTTHTLTVNVDGEEKPVVPVEDQLVVAELEDNSDTNSGALTSRVKKTVENAKQNYMLDNFTLYNDDNPSRGWLFILKDTAQTAKNGAITEAGDDIITAAKFSRVTEDGDKLSNVLSYNYDRGMSIVRNENVINKDTLGTGNTSDVMGYSNLTSFGAIEYWQKPLDLGDKNAPVVENLTEHNLENTEATSATISLNLSDDQDLRYVEVYTRKDGAKKFTKNARDYVLETCVENAGVATDTLTASYSYTIDSIDEQVEYYVNVVDGNHNVTTMGSEENPLVISTQRIIQSYPKADASAYVGVEAPDCESEGYVFAGWYADKECNKTPIRNAEQLTDTVYALFVLEDVLQVKAQITADVSYSEQETGLADMRFLTTVDSLRYSEVGFDFDINGTKSTKSSNTVYRGLYVINQEGKTDPVTPKYFTGLSNYFVAYTFTDIPDTDWTTKIWVRPYWKTLDGVTVYGTADYVEKTVEQGKVDSVARIDTLYFSDFSHAVEVAEDNETVELLKNATVNETLALDRDVTVTTVEGTDVTLTRGAELTEAMFTVADTGSLTITGTENYTITVDGNKDNVTATDSMIVNAGTFTLGTNAGLTNAGNASIEFGGALYNTGTATLEGTLSGNAGERGGAIYNNGGTVTFNAGEYSENTASVHGAVIMSANGEVEVTGGTFTNNTATDRGGVILSNNADVTIRGGEFSYNTAEGVTGGGVYGGTATAVLTITGGNFSNNKATGEGATGGVIESNGKVTIQGGTYTSNEATHSGGVIGADVSSVLSVSGENTVFDSNKAGRGAVIYLPNGGKKATINGGSYTKNEASVHAGVIFSDGGEVEITSGTFANNTATDRAGVILSKGTVTISGGEFSTNEAKGTTGGGVYGGTSTATLTITGGSFSNNTASNASAGGGVIESTGTVTIEGGTFSSNTATNGGVIISKKITTISGGTFELNSATIGGVVYKDAVATLSITGGNFGTTVGGNTATDRGGVLYIADASTQTTTIDGAVFYGNKVISSSISVFGGVIFVGVDSDAEIGLNAACRFESNESSYTGTSSSKYGYGGCIFMTTASSAEVTVKNTEFLNNNARIGGAICVQGGALKVDGGNYSNNYSGSNLEDIRCNNATTLALSGEVSQYVGLNNTGKILVNEELDANSKVYIRIVNASSITSSKTRAVVEFAEGLMPDDSQTIFAMCSAQASKYAMTFASNKLTLSLK